VGLAAEFEGLISVMEVLRNTSKAMKDRALPGPDPVPQIPELAERGMIRGQRFFKTLDARLSETPWLAGRFVQLRRHHRVCVRGVRSLGEDGSR
jgi:glutathione S-transferase